MLGPHLIFPMRIGHSLNEAEKNNVTSRRESDLVDSSMMYVVFTAFFTARDAQHRTCDDLLDCVLYLAGLSGSTWCMASLYKEPNWYSNEKHDFSLADIWAALFITKIVKEIDEQTFSDLRNKQSTQDPYPIYTVIDMQSNCSVIDTFVEITPYETGYSITGAFVDTSSFGSQFDQGVKIKDQPEMDMLFLQGKMIYLVFSSPPVQLSVFVLLIFFCRSVDPLHFVTHENHSLNLGNGIWTVIVKCLKLLTLWIWGTTYNFLYNMEKRRYIDAGIANNSPFFLPLLRKERHIDLIVSLDFSENDPFEVEQLHTVFLINLHSEKSAPNDFYVFKGQNKPTVIHIPLFNVVNCGAEIESWKRKYKTFQQPYSRDLIQELLDKAGMNIKNNKENLLTEIKKIIQGKTLHYCSVC
uniref:PLA2c domain-containing protein n=1 Tax=Sinocyclocheilus rhinocerous TaxID=307959 RepID=A0A673M0N4_9TELE